MDESDELDEYRNAVEALSSLAATKARELDGLIAEADSQQVLDGGWYESVERRLSDSLRELDSAVKALEVSSGIDGLVERFESIESDLEGAHDNLSDRLHSAREAQPEAAKPIVRELLVELRDELDSYSREFAEAGRDADDVEVQLGEAAEIAEPEETTDDDSADHPEEPKY